MVDDRGGILIRCFIIIVDELHQEFRSWGVFYLCFTPGGQWNVAQRPNLMATVRVEERQVE